MSDPQATEDLEEVVEDILEELPKEEEPEENQDNEIDYEKEIQGLKERISDLEGRLSEEQKINETLSELIEGEDPLEEDQEQVVEVNVVEQFKKAQGAEATQLFKKNKEQIIQAFNQSRRS